MGKLKIKRGLISAYDKSGVVEFARSLHDEFGVEIISTGGTARTLREAGIPVTLVEQVTGSPEILDGRVKTLHPKIHAAILADRDNPEHMRELSELGVEPIDMVVVNLYPFEQTIADPQCRFEDAMEMIDIGGPCMLRAAAKNHRHVLAISDASLYEQVLELLRGNVEAAEAGRLRQAWAARAFVLTRMYDRAISTYLTACAGGRITGAAATQELEGEPIALRYGENPHQIGVVLRSVGSGEPSVAGGELLTPGEISFNNYLDGEACLQLCRELVCSQVVGSQETVVAVLVKHANPCGAAMDADAIEAYRKAYLGYPAAAFGGVLAVSCPVTADLAEAVMFSYDKWGKQAGATGFYLNVWIAPAFDEQALELIRKAKAWGQRARLLAVGDIGRPPDPNELEIRKISGGMLLQTRDLIGLDEERWQVVTKRSPSPQEMLDLRFAWLVCKHTKSNAITIAQDGMLLGTGAGQMSRVMSCKIAVELAAPHLARAGRSAGQAPSPVAASDAYFPFRDGPELLMDAGVTAIIQPGGSSKDEQVVAACDERDAAMIFTRTRHFRH